MIRLQLTALIGVAALLGGCSKAPEAPRPDNAAASAAATGPAEGTASATAESSAGGARKVAESNDTYEFTYSYPAAAGRIAPLASLLDARMATKRKELQQDAAEAKADATGDSYPFRPYGWGADWQVVTELPGWLSLSAQIYTEYGGAHPNGFFDSLLWDKQAGVARAPLDLFASPAALEKVVQPALCDAVDKQRSVKRREAVKRDPADWASACIGLDSTVVILGSSNRKTFDRIGFLIAPYNAGPYVEGSYEVTLPVTPAILSAVKPEYRSAFSIKR